MKRDDKKKLLQSTSEDLSKKLTELETDILKARQERFSQTAQGPVNIRRAYELRKQLKMIKTELRQREIAAASTVQTAEKASK